MSYEYLCMSKAIDGSIREVQEADDSITRYMLTCKNLERQGIISYDVSSLCYPVKMMSKDREYSTWIASIGSPCSTPSVIYRIINETAIQPDGNNQVARSESRDKKVLMYSKDMFNDIEIPYLLKKVMPYCRNIEQVYCRSSVSKLHTIYRVNNYKESVIQDSRVCPQDLSHIQCINYVSIKKFYRNSMSLLSVQMRCVDAVVTCCISQIILFLISAVEECSFSHNSLTWSDIRIIDTDDRQLFYKLYNIDTLYICKGKLVKVCNMSRAYVKHGDVCIRPSKRYSDHTYGNSCNPFVDIYSLFKHSGSPVYERYKLYIYGDLDIKALASDVSCTRDHPTYIQWKQRMLNNIIIPTVASNHVYNVHRYTGSTSSSETILPVKSDLSMDDVNEYTSYILSCIWNVLGVRILDDTGKLSSDCVTGMRDIIYNVRRCVSRYTSCKDVNRCNALYSIYVMVDRCILRSQIEPEEWMIDLHCIMSRMYKALMHTCSSMDDECMIDLLYGDQCSYSDACNMCINRSHYNSISGRL